MSKSSKLETPVYICEMSRLERNLKKLDEIQEESGLKILLALKGFALPESFGLISHYLYGASASSYNEVRLAYEQFGKATHTYLPAFKDNEIEQIAKMSDTIIFNSLSQWERFYPRVKEVASCGLRINLELPLELPAYCDPNRAQSRLGILPKTIDELPKEVEGLHIHALCSQGVDAFTLILVELERQCGHWLSQLNWLNLGGGHALSHESYDHERLIALAQSFRKKHPHITLYLEPSEAIVHKSGVLVASVLDIVHNGIDIAMLDISVEAHMVDVLLTKQAPKVRHSSKSGKYHYQLAGISCAAGDIIGNYSFKAALSIGDKVIFEDQMAYSMVKNNAFNGIDPANIALMYRNGEIVVVKEFGYEDYLKRS